MKTIGTLVGASALLLSLTACDRLAEKAIETAIERSIASESGGDVDINLRDGTVNVRGEDGDSSVAFGQGANLPRNFPTDDIPLPKNAKLTMAVNAGGGYMLTYESVPAAEAQRISDKLIDEGYEEVMSMATADGQTVSLKGEKWSVTLTWGNAEGAMTYHVGPTDR